MSTDPPRYLIRAKPGNGKLFINIITGKFEERKNASLLCANDAVAWLDQRDEPETFTYIDSTTGKEYSYYDGPPSNVE